MKLKDNPVICWFSGGVTSAVACKLSIDLFGIDNCRVVFIDTHNEDADTYRFLYDCEKWYGKEIETISSEKFHSIFDVWDHYQGMNFATGAICSSELKRDVRRRFLEKNSYSYNVFGFDMGEPKRALAMTLNWDINPIYPLLLHGYTKKKCISIIQDAGIELPKAYRDGYHNNNCRNTGCVQGGIGYWQKIQKEEPEKFNAMAEREHRYTNSKGHPVTILKDQSKEAKKTGRFQVFLKPHVDYPDYKDISMMKGREVEPIIECNGFCGTYDLTKVPVVSS